MLRLFATLLIFVQSLIAVYSLSICNFLKNSHHLVNLDIDFVLDLSDFVLDLSDFSLDSVLNLNVLVSIFLSKSSILFLGILDKSCDSFGLLLEHTLLLDKLSFPCLGFHTLSLLLLDNKEILILFKLFFQVNKI